MTDALAQATEYRVLGSAQSIAAAANAVSGEFASLPDGSRRLEHILALGRSFDGIVPEERHEKDRVRGCQSQLWLVIEFQDDVLRLRADSDALIMRGLLSLVIRLYSSRHASEISESAADLLPRLVAAHGLAPSRSGGLQAIVSRIREAAFERIGAEP